MTIPDRFTHDCSRCSAMCCVTLAFEASEEFAITKAGGEPCPNLRADDTCAIHGRLVEEGFPGCVAWTCHGAGQRVQAMYPGRSWRGDPALAAEMFGRMRVVRVLHRLIIKILESSEVALDGPLPPAARILESLADDPARLPPITDPDAAESILKEVLRDALAGGREP